MDELDGEEEEESFGESLETDPSSASKGRDREKRGTESDVTVREEGEGGRDARGKRDGK